MPKVYNIFSQIPATNILEPQSPEIITVPDMSLSPREIIDRFSKGKSVPQNRDIMYSGDDFFPDPKRLDMAVIDHMIDETQQHIKAVKNQINDKIEHDKLMSDLKNQKQHLDKKDNSDV